MLNQKLVGMVISLCHQMRQGDAHVLVNARPRLARHLRLGPLIHHDACQGFGAHHILGVQVVAALQMPHADAQVVEFLRGHVCNAQDQPRRQDA